MNDTGKIKKEKIYNIVEIYGFPILILIGIFIINSWFLVTKGAEYIDSDMASNLLAGHVFNSEGVLMSKNWIYSTVLAFMASENFYQLAFLICPNNWILARAIGVMVMLILQTAVIYSFALACGEIKTNAILISAFSLFPMSFWYMLMITFGGYYTANTLFSFLVLLLIVLYTRKEDKDYLKKYIIIGISIFIGILLGIAGIKYMLFPYGPIIVASVLMILLRLAGNKLISDVISTKEIRLFAISVISTVSYMIGYGINMLVLSKKYVFESHNEMNWGKMNFMSFVSGVAEFLSLFGYQNDEQANSLSLNRTNPKVFSIQGIATVFGLLMICYLVFSVIRLIQRYNGLMFYEQLVLIFLLCTILVDGIIFKWTEGFDAGAQYWIPAVPLGFFVMIIEMRTEDYAFIQTKKVITAILSFCLFVTSISTINQYETQPLEANPHLVEVADWLVDNGYTEGYATFWQGNSLTALSNGKLDMWVVYDLEEMLVYQWLQETRHLNPPTADKVFAIVGPNDTLNRDEIITSICKTPGRPEKVYEDEEGYIIVEYKK